eukprot:s689_g41.t3
MGPSSARNEGQLGAKALGPGVRKLEALRSRRDGPSERQSGTSVVGFKYDCFIDQDDAQTKTRELRGILSTALLNVFNSIPSPLQEPLPSYDVSKLARTRPCAPWAPFG